MKKTPIFLIVSFVLGFLFTTSSTQSFAAPTPTKKLAEADFFGSGNTLTLQIFKDSTDSEEDDSDPSYFEESESLSLGLFDSDGILVEALHQLEDFDGSGRRLDYHSVALKDLNTDGKMDLVVTIREEGDEVYQKNTASFFLNDGNTLNELKESFSIDQFEFVDSRILKVNEPIFAFGQPFDEGETDKNNETWVNYYQFTDLGLESANHLYKSYYQTVKLDAEKKLSAQVSKIRAFKMNLKNPSENQLQLSEFYHQITVQKIIIARCLDVL